MLNIQSKGGEKMAEASQVIIVACKKCAEETLIRTDVRIGDNVLCANCGARSKVTGVSAPFRYDSKSIRHTGEVIP